MRVRPYLTFVEFGVYSVGGVGESDPNKEKEEMEAGDQEGNYYIRSKGQNI
jgi:hypothetical protein